MMGTHISSGFKEIIKKKLRKDIWLHSFLGREWQDD